MVKKVDNCPVEGGIPLLRGGNVVSGLCGAIGHSLSETRIISFLGYLIALEPESFIKKFGFSGKIVSVSLETLHQFGRSDILIGTTEGNGVVEAKIDATDPLKQSRKYTARWRVLLTQYVPSEKQKNMRNIRYLRWQDIGKLLSELSHSQNLKVQFVSKDLLTYLEGYHMIKQKESVEIYDREINEENTLRLFLKAQLYCCYYEKQSRLPESLYFAPHFGKKITNLYPGVQVGISYIARIETVEVVEAWKDLVNSVKSVRGKHWFNNHKSLLEPLRKYLDWTKGKKVNLFFLYTPRFAFNPPVKKENLQRGKGWLSRRFLSFDDLFSAWGK